jgi:acyl-homoserine lactone acylase PvdQ
MLQLARRFSVRARIGLVVALALLAAGTGPRAAAVPEKGTEILWDTYGIPHIFAPDHPSLFYAYGYAQMEGHAELLTRLYAQARGRGAEFYGDAYLASDRWVRTTGIPQKAKQWEANLCRRAQRVDGQEPECPQRAGEARAAIHGGGRLRAWAAHHPLRLADP